MTVTERLYDNDWYVAHAAPAPRQLLAVDVMRTRLALELAREDAQRAKGVASLSPSRFAIALSSGSAAHAEHRRAQARAEEAARCTDIVGGHAFTITRSGTTEGGMTMEVHSCTLARYVTLSVSGPGSGWTAQLVDPIGRWGNRETVRLGADPWESLHWACDWVTASS
jgi:hypothetical protein